MRKICKVTVNNEPFLANCGELLLDWALLNGVELPHDCRSGICGACRVRLVEGKVVVQRQNAVIAKCPDAPAEIVAHLSAGAGIAEGEVTSVQPISQTLEIGLCQ